MRQRDDEITQNLAERLCWEAARRDDARVARRLYRTQEVEGVYRLDEGAVVDDFWLSRNSRGNGSKLALSPCQTIGNIRPSFKRCSVFTGIPGEPKFCCPLTPPESVGEGTRGGAA